MFLLTSVNSLSLFLSIVKIICFIVDWEKHKHSLKRSMHTELKIKEQNLVGGASPGAPQ